MLFILSAGEIFKRWERAPQSAASAAALFREKAGRRGADGAASILMRAINETWARGGKPSLDPHEKDAVVQAGRFMIQGFLMKKPKHDFLFFFLLRCILLV